MFSRWNKEIVKHVNMLDYGRGSQAPSLHIATAPEGFLV